MCSYSRKEMPRSLVVEHCWRVSTLALRQLSKLEMDNSTEQEDDAYVKASILKGFVLLRENKGLLWAFESFWPLRFVVGDAD